MPVSPKPEPRGRGSHFNPPNRFGGLHYVPDFDALGDDEEYLHALEHPRNEYIPDRSRSVVTSNDSPDVPFRYSLNPYRGCQHGCSYCFARQTHEYLGYGAGLDFETKILVKHDAPALFRDFLARDGWDPEPVVLSGVTDCYQPAERRFELTRSCLEVAVSARQPISIVTKNALVLRDLDLLSELAVRQLVHVNLSITTLNDGLARCMEPRTSTPAGRLRAVRGLSAAGVPVRVLVAPIIPGLNDCEIPAILAAVHEAGARGAGYQLVRLPLTVAPVFLEWLARTHPDRAAGIEGRIRDMRGGRLNLPEFGQRMRGEGEAARQIGTLFRLFARRYRLDGDLPPYDGSHFRPPVASSGQQTLF